MKKINFIARSDDLASSISANHAIDAVSRAGFIKNVSIMAPGAAVEDAAHLLAHRKDICFGMHTTLNAEWDRIKWAPVLPIGKESGLVDDNGYFLSNPSLFLETKPAVEIIMREVDAQLEKLHSLGFDIKYLDSHMFPEFFIEGLDEAMALYAKQKGLIDHMYFYNIPPGFHDLRNGLESTLNHLKILPEGQYFIVTHPSQDTEEMRNTGNAQYSGEEIAKSRAYEAQIFSDPEVCQMLTQLGCEGIRYDEAVPQKRATPADFKQMFTNNNDRSTNRAEGSQS
ncbi:ChbG/HpnK family deacetylase [Lachnospiraceae bacterium OttesenSCG-928-D06]|nr:ChbG/HpnK family deacetylase [Lachnospiraceae bacterium OttesenSCG-928-D06]